MPGSGEPEDVAMALYEQYLPRFAGDSIPSAPAGALIGIADRADTLAAIYKIGLEPTSSQDPYGLRRAARCINEIIWGFPLDIDIYLLLEKAASPFSIDKETLEDRSFVRQRPQNFSSERIRHEVVELVLQTISNIVRFRHTEWLTPKRMIVCSRPYPAAVRVKNI